MSKSTQPAGGFVGDPAAALAPAGSGGCCGNPAQATSVVLPPVDPVASLCCGTPAEAQAAGSCCGGAAKAEAVAAGAGCCG